MSTVTAKNKKIIFILCAIFCCAVFVMLLTFGVFLATNKTNGYYTFGAKRGLIIADSLMESETYVDALERGGMALFNTKFDPNRDVAKGQIILFRTKVDNEVYFSARRVSAKLVKTLPSGLKIVTYEVKADASKEVLPFEVAPSDIFGICTGQSASLGAFFAFLNSFTGFAVLLLLPGVFAAVLVVVMARQILYQKRHGTEK